MASTCAKLTWKVPLSIGKWDGSQANGSAFLDARPSDEPLPDPPGLATCSLRRVSHPAVQPVKHAWPYWWLPLCRGSPQLAGRDSSVAFATREVSRSVLRIRSVPATPATSRRWSSTGLEDDDDDSPRPARHSTIPGTASATAALSAVRAKLAFEIRTMETPTPITLRRASAVLDTVAQRRVGDASDDPKTAPTRRGSGAQPAVGYRITREELSGLVHLVQRTLADGTRHGVAAGSKGKARAGSAPARMMSYSGLLKSGPADVAVTVADVHTTSRRASAASATRRGSVGAQGVRRSSIVSAVLPARKSVHEIVWEEDGTPQSLRSSTWNCGGGGEEKRGDGALAGIGWKSESFCREGTGEWAIPRLVFTPFWGAAEADWEAALNPPSPLPATAAAAACPTTAREGPGDLAMPPLVFTPFWAASSGDERGALTQPSPPPATSTATSPLTKDAISFFPPLPPPNSASSADEKSPLTQPAAAAASPLAGDAVSSFFPPLPQRHAAVASHADSSEEADHRNLYADAISFFPPLPPRHAASQTDEKGGLAQPAAAATSSLTNDAVSFFPPLPPHRAAVAWHADGAEEADHHTLYADGGVDDTRRFSGATASEVAAVRRRSAAAWVERVRIAGAGVEVGVWTRGRRGWGEEEGVCEGCGERW